MQIPEGLKGFILRPTAGAGLDLGQQKLRRVPLRAQS
jgi:hypothetical protein